MSDFQSSSYCFLYLCNLFRSVCHCFLTYPQNIAADDLSDLIICIASLDQSHRKKRPVCPGKRIGMIRSQSFACKIFCRVLPVLFPDVASRRHGTVFRFPTLDTYSMIRTYGNMIHTEFLCHIINMVQEGVDGKISLQEGGIGTDPHIAAGLFDCFNDLIAFAPVVGG